MAYGPGQVIHAIPFNRPIDSGCPTPFLTTHYQYTVPNKLDYHGVARVPSRAVWGGNSVEEARQLLDKGIIEPGGPGYWRDQLPCCGVWPDGRKHAWWCEKHPCMPGYYGLEKDPVKIELYLLESIVLEYRELKLRGIDWRIPAHIMERLKK